MSEDIKSSHTASAVEISTGQIKHRREDKSLSVESFILFWMAALFWLACLSVFMLAYAFDL